MACSFIYGQWHNFTCLFHVLGVVLIFTFEKLTDVTF